MSAPSPYAGLPRGSLIILQALVGSTVHGTAVAQQDDRDELAICIEPPVCMLGGNYLGPEAFESLMYRTQPEGVRSGPGDLDLTIHSLRKFARLAASGNPSIMLPLFVPAKDLIGKTHALGHRLREIRSLFVSKRMGERYLGYMQAQRERMTGERGQKRVTRQELVDQYGFDTKYAGHVVRLAHQGIELMKTGHLSLPMPKAEADLVVAVRTGKFTFQQVLALAMDLEAALRTAIDSTSCPAAPDQAAIDRFVVDAYLWTWVPSRLGDAA